jgi:hypothetical protein
MVPNFYECMEIKTAAEALAVADAAGADIPKDEVPKDEAKDVPNIEDVAGADMANDKRQNGVKYWPKPKPIEFKPKKAFKDTTPVSKDKPKNYKPYNDKREDDPEDVPSIEQPEDEPEDVPSIEEPEDEPEDVPSIEDAAGADMYKDKPYNDKPYNDKPQNYKPYNDKPYNDNRV